MKVKAVCQLHNIICVRMDGHLIRIVRFILAFTQWFIAHYTQRINSSKPRWWHCNQQGINMIEYNTLSPFEVITKLFRRIFKIKHYTGRDCHYCTAPIVENDNQVFLLNGRYAVRTMCKPCHSHGRHHNKS